MSERLSAKQIKHDIREDEVQSFLITAIERFQENRGLYAMVFFGLLGTGVLISVAAGLMDRRAVAAEIAEEPSVAVIEAGKP